MLAEVVATGAVVARDMVGAVMVGLAMELVAAVESAVVGAVTALAEVVVGTVAAEVVTGSEAPAPPVYTAGPGMVYEVIPWPISTKIPGSVAE